LENVEGYWSELVSVFPRFPFLSLYWFWHAGEDNLQQIWHT
jgi:hypothetical protein